MAKISSNFNSQKFVLNLFSFTKNISSLKMVQCYQLKIKIIFPIQTDAVPEHIRQMMLFQIPLGKFGEVEDIAETAAFLASDRAKYINGAAIDVNGGLLQHLFLINGLFRRMSGFFFESKMKGIHVLIYCRTTSNFAASFCQSRCANFVVRT